MPDDTIPPAPGTGAGIPSAVISAAENTVDQLHTSLEQYMRPLTTLQRKRMSKLGPRLQSFVEHCEAYAAANSHFRPGHIDMEAFSAHLSTVHEMWNLIDKIEQLVVLLKDTLTAEGSDALEAAYAYYNNLKRAASNNAEGAKAQLEDLASRLPHYGPKHGGEGSESGEAR